MAASYPTSLKTFTTKTNKVDDYDASHVNDIQDEIEAVQTELGTDVSGSETDLKTRLAVSISDDGAIAKGTSFPDSPIDGQPFYRTDEDTFYIYDGSAWESISSFSNVLFSWSGNITESSGVELVTNNSSLTVSTALGNSYSYYRTDSTSYKTIFQFQWVRIAGVASVNAIAGIWQTGNTGATRTASIQVDVNGSTASGTGTNGQITPEAVATSPVNVTGLTVGNAYDVKLKLSRSANNTHAFIGWVIVFGS